MSKFIFKKMPTGENEYDISTCTLEFSSVSRSEILEHFIEFLASCGFSVDDLNDEIGASEEVPRLEEENLKLKVALQSIRNSISVLDEE